MKDKKQPKEWLSELRLRLKNLLQRRQLDKDLRDEVAFHIAMREDDLRREGDRDPRHAARRRFGSATRVAEECREAWTFVRIERLLSDFRYAARSLRKKPGFTVVAVLTLALGIGANSAVFSAIDTILLRPLPFPEGDQLVSVDHNLPKANSSSTLVAPLRLADWERMNSTFQAITGYYTEDVSETSGALPEKITRAWTAPRFFQVWGIGPSIGREFAPDEEKFRGPAAVVISDRLWRRRFNGDPTAVGKQLRLEKVGYTIVGVMPASFLFPDRTVDIWTPSPTDAPYAQSREATWFRVIGRLKPGVTTERGRADLATVQNQLGQQYPKTDADLVVRIRPMKDVTIADSGSSLWILYGSVTLLLLIACTNIAALMLARSSDREQEISIRFSLGASRMSIMTRLLAESFLVALAGSVLGLLIATGTADVFRTLASGLPRVEEVRLNWTLVFYSLGCAVTATFLCGLLPALRSVRRSIAGSLAHGGRSQVSAGSRLQWSLVAVQVALSVILLAGAGLLLRSFQELGRVSPGFDPAHVLTFRISANWGETTDIKALWRRIDDTLDSLRAIPGVEAASTSLFVPGVPAQYQRDMRMVDGAADSNTRITANSRIVSTGYFETMHIPVIAGAACGPTQTTTVLINRSFADTYLGGAPGIGHHVDNVPPNPYVGAGEIIGLSEDAREEGLNREPTPTVYWCNSAPTPSPVFLVRTAAEPAAMAETVRRKIHEIQPSRSVYDIKPLEEHLDQTFSENRLRTILLTFFALTAAALASLGVYGTLSYFVNMRRREVGLRIALGARPREIAAQFIRQGLRACVLGGVAGLCVSLAIGRLLAGVLYGVSPTDPATFIIVLAVTLLSGTAASIIPALRAARLKPVDVLRGE